MTTSSKLVVLLGPTGVGKTELSYSIADYLSSPIISADSRQLYREISVGTAAPTSEQLAKYTHYFINTLELDDYYSAAKYEADALQLMWQLFSTHKALLLTGGSMMYIDAVCDGIDDIPTVDEETRSMMLERYKEEGLERLVQELRLLDPEYYEIVDRKNPKRVIHALEICYMTGKTYTSFRTRTISPRPFEHLKIGLTRPREELYNRINERVTQMVENGLVEEARAIWERYRKQDIPRPNSLNTVGYKELFDYFEGKCTFNEAIEKIRQDTRRYARKQMTWFRRDEDILWFHPNQKTEIFQAIDDFLQR